MSYVFPTFLIMIKNQFETSVDNARELSFVELFKAKGIISFHSCPETLNIIRFSKEYTITF